MAPNEKITEYEHPHKEEALPENDWVSTPNVVRTDKTLVVKDFFVADDNEVRMLRGQRIARKAVTGNYTVAVLDFLIGVTSLAVAPNIGLPKPSLAQTGKTYLIKDEAGGAATTAITIRSDGEANIDGAASTTLSTNFQAKKFYTDSINWYTM